MGYRLYGTTHCHLCKQAQGLLAQCRIAVDDALLERYGVRIPVLSRVADGAELDWPFDAKQLGLFCG